MQTDCPAIAACSANLGPAQLSFAIQHEVLEIRMTLIRVPLFLPGRFFSTFVPASQISAIKSVKFPLVFAALALHPLHHARCIIGLHTAGQRRDDRRR